AATEVSWGTTACLVTLTPVIVSVYGVELLPMLFPAAASTNRSKSASGGSPTSGWLGAFSSTMLSVKAVYTRVRLAWLSFIGPSPSWGLDGVPSAYECEHGAAHVPMSVPGRYQFQALDARRLVAQLSAGIFELIPLVARRGGIN